MHCVIRHQTLQAYVGQAFKTYRKTKWKLTLETSPDMWFGRSFETRCLDHRDKLTLRS